MKNSSLFLFILFQLAIAVGSLKAQLFTYELTCLDTTYSAAYDSARIWIDGTYIEFQIKGNQYEEWQVQSRDGMFRDVYLNAESITTEDSTYIEPWYHHHLDYDYAIELEEERDYMECTPTGRTTDILDYSSEQYEVKFEDFIDTLWLSKDVPVFWPGYDFLPGMPLTGTVRYEGNSYQISLKDVDYDRKSSLIKELEMKTIELTSDMYYDEYNDSTILIYGQIKDYYTDEPLSNVPVTVFYVNENYYLPFVADEDGFYGLQIYTGEHIYLFFGSEEEHVVKLIEIDSRGAEETDFPSFEINMDITLFEPRKKEDWEFMRDPLGIARYNPDTQDLGFDFEYTGKMMEKVNAVLDRRR